MRERVCKNCGGRQYKVVGQNMVKCMFCGTLYVDEQASKEEEVLIVGAYEKLRELDFSSATNEFNKIISLFPKSFEAYFGRALSKNKIILYNGRGANKTPRFFGDEIPDLSKDEDFQKAKELAPYETGKSYEDYAKKISRIRESASKIQDSTKVFVCQMNYTKTSIYPQTNEFIDALNKENIPSFFATSSAKEEQLYLALKNAKTLVLFADKEEDFAKAEYKNILDRYTYFCNQKKKAKSSIIIVYNKEKIDQKSQIFKTFKSTIEINEENFANKLAQTTKAEINKTYNVEVKLNSKKIESVKPEKREYTNIESVSPTELGHYFVENVSMSEESKIKWIFLLLKNGDFASAQEETSIEIQKDQNNPDLIFAQLMIDAKAKTEEEFFSNISNLKNRENIDKYLTYASKKEAETFVDNFEKQISQIDSEEYYNEYLLYFAKFDTPNRQDFISSAENKAIETLNEDLIEKVSKCFDTQNIDQFVGFYFALAQNSGDTKFYDKVLEIDQGHVQSNLAIFLKNFKTTEDRLSFRDAEKFEEFFKFIPKEARGGIVSAVIDTILPVAFLDIEEAEKQIDFYLSYIEDEKILCAQAKRIAEKFLQMSFFTLAEKYVTLSISKDKSNAGLYWLLILSKAHCRTDIDLISSNLKVSQFPEWETLLSVATDEEAEHFAEVVSKANMYSNKKLHMKEEMLDKKTLTEKLNDFLLRNNKILLELEKQNQNISGRGTNYYKLQLKPFEKYLADLDKIESFDEYQELYEKAIKRLSYLGLSLESSISLIDAEKKNEGFKFVEEEEKQEEQQLKNQQNREKRKKLTKTILFSVLVAFPILFSTILYAIALANPKAIYMHFSQEFLIYCLFISIFYGILFFFIHKFAKSEMSKSKKLLYLAIILISALNMGLMFGSFYVDKNPITASNAKELSVLTQNAKYSNIEIDTDIDMLNFKWDTRDFYGTFDGNGHTISNLTFADSAEIGMFRNNTGTIKNLTIILANHTYQKVENFGTIAVASSGTISNIEVQGVVTLRPEKEVVAGGLVAGLCGGTIKNCDCSLTIDIAVENTKSYCGGVAGKVNAAKKKSTIYQNDISTGFTTLFNNSSASFFGGAVGYLGECSLNFSQNFVDTNMTFSGTINADLTVGGLVGFGLSKSSDNAVEGQIDFSTIAHEVVAGGIYGEYRNQNAAVVHSYSKVSFYSNENSSTEIGGLVGDCSGLFRECFYTQSIDFVGNLALPTMNPRDCKQLTTPSYVSSLKFSADIWNLPTNDYPQLLWTI